MISDEPDEDADTLDDDAAMELCLGEIPTKSAGALLGPPAADWPTGQPYGFGLRLDPETLTWFKTAYADWQTQMREVLRAWMRANAATQQPSKNSQAADDQS